MINFKFPGALILTDGKKESIPTCSKCLDPFEDDDQVFVIDYERRLGLLNDFRHKECFELRSIKVQDLKK